MEISKMESYLRVKCFMNGKSKRKVWVRAVKKWWKILIFLSNFFDKISWKCAWLDGIQVRAVFRLDSVDFCLLIPAKTNEWLFSHLLRMFIYINAVKPKINVSISLHFIWKMFLFNFNEKVFNCCFKPALFSY